MASPASSAASRRAEVSGLSPRVDEARNRLQQPGRGVALRQRAEAHLLDQQDPVAHRVVGQHRGGIGHAEDGAQHLGPVGAVETPEPRRHLLDREEPVIGMAALDDLDVVGGKAPPDEPRTPPRPAAQLRIRPASG